MRVTAAGALAAAAVAAVVAMGPRPARAADCGRPDLRDTVPPDGATDVPPNAALFAHYVASAERVDEVAVLRLRANPLVLFEGRTDWDATQGLLTFTPAEPLMADVEYELEWPALRGLNTSAPGLGGIVHFTAGAVNDDNDPSFDGLTGLSWELERRKNDCTDSLENRFLFRLELGSAGDDGGRDGLTLVVFQTAGGAVVDGSSVPVLSASLPAVGVPVEVRLPVEDATGHVCFAAFVRDLTGKVSGGGATSVCVETTAPPFFQGCAVAPAGGPSGAAAALLLAASGLVARRRRRGWSKAVK